MDFKTVFAKKTAGTPAYERSPQAPVKVKVLVAKTTEKVLTWDYSGGTARPLRSVMNTTAALTDGHAVVKMVIYERQAAKLKLGRSYIIRNYGLGMILYFIFY